MYCVSIATYSVYEPDYIEVTKKLLHKLWAGLSSWKHAEYYIVEYHRLASPEGIFQSKL